MLKIFPHFRPDLLDWRQVERRDVRERIDLAFHIMDREYGVTRLLDPEGKQRFTVLDRSSALVCILLCEAGPKQETDWLFVSCLQIRQGVVAGLVAFLPPRLSME